MSGLKKRILVFHESIAFLNEVKLAAGRNANLITAHDAATAEAALKLYNQIDVCLVEKTTMSTITMEFLAQARKIHPRARRVMIVETDAISNAYPAIQTGVIESYYFKPIRLIQLREAMGLPEPHGPSQAEMAAVLKRVNLQPPLTGGRSASSSPSLK